MIGSGVVHERGDTAAKTFRAGDERLTGAGADDSPPAARKGQFWATMPSRIGRYTIERKLGKGGRASSSRRETIGSAARSR